MSGPSGSARHGRACPGLSRPSTRPPRIERFPGCRVVRQCYEYSERCAEERRPRLRLCSVTAWMAGTSPAMTAWAAPGDSLPLSVWQPCRQIIMNSLAAPPAASRDCSAHGRSPGSRRIADAVFPSEAPSGEIASARRSQSRGRPRIGERPAAFPFDPRRCEGPCTRYVPAWQWVVKFGDCILISYY